MVTVRIQKAYNSVRYRKIFRQIIELNYFSYEGFSYTLHPARALRSVKVRITFSCCDLQYGNRKCMVLQYFYQDSENKEYELVSQFRAYSELGWDSDLTCDCH